MYAYNDGKEWTTQAVAMGVSEAPNQPTTLAPMQGVGLAFDAENLPVISFTATGWKNLGGLRSDFPHRLRAGAFQLILLAAGAMLVLVKVGKSRKNRQ